MELADIFRQHWSEYCKSKQVSAAEQRVATAIMRCRTAELGGHLLQCNGCGKQEISYNSCRNRHCPKCGGGKTAQWVTERSKELLPVGYFHTVFTLPAGLRPLARVAPREIYDLFFQAVSKTLLEVGERNLRVEIAATCLLHTWGSSMVYHPHIHCIIPGCGIMKDGTPKRFQKKRYFVPDKILSRVFRGKLCSLIKRAYRKGQLPFHFDDIDAYLDTIVTKEWVVRTKPPFAGPKTVLKYLARYTNRIAISNKRILSASKQHISFRYKDYRRHSRIRTMKLHPHEFMRRYLLHVLPHHFVRIRHYGFLARTKKVLSITLLKKAFGDSRQQEIPSNPHSDTCPHCKQGKLIKILEFPPRSAFHPPGFFH